jgi:hypothetical protein
MAPHVMELKVADLRDFLTGARIHTHGWHWSVVSKKQR